jgi:hypothetical protein
LSISKCFEHFPEHFENSVNKMIIWITDSMVVQNVLSKGSRIKCLQDQVIAIKEFEFKNNFVLVPKWVSRDNELLQLADAGSKLYKSSNEYGISTFDFNFIEEFFDVKFTIDGFAIDKNKRTKLFISYLPQIGALDLNFFHHELLSQHVYYLHPPVSLITRCIKKVLLYPNVRAVIIIPLWKSHSFFTFIHKAGFFKSYIRGVLRFKPLFVAFSPTTKFKGYMNFDNLALAIDTSTENAIPYEL